MKLQGTQLVDVEVSDNRILYGAIAILQDRYDIPHNSWLSDDKRHIMIKDAEYPPHVDAEKVYRICELGDKKHIDILYNLALETR